MSHILLAETDAGIIVLAVIFAIGIIVAGVLFAIYQQKEQAERLAKSRKRYREALDRLADKPSAARRRAALAAGRDLMQTIEILRASNYKEFLPTVDEMTIQNDLEAASERDE